MAILTVVQAEQEIILHSEASLLKSTNWLLGQAGDRYRFQMTLVNVEVPKQHGPIDPTLLQIIGIIIFETRIRKVVFAVILLQII